PAGISCPGTCSATFPGGTAVSLAAAAGAGSSFFGWSGGCSGASSCDVTLDSNQSVTATFTPPLQGLSVSIAGSGSVASNPACVPTASVTLTATPSGLSTFAGWFGSCSGTGTCPLSMASPRAATATFSPPAAPVVDKAALFGTTNDERGTGIAVGGGYVYFC